MHKDLTELTLVLIESSDEGTIDDEVRIESCNLTMASLCLTQLLSYNYASGFSTKYSVLRMPQESS